MRKSQYTNQELELAKLKRKKINKCQKIIREILFNFMFIWILFVVSYSNRNSSSFYYQSQIAKTFSVYSDVMKAIEKKFFK